MCWVAVISQSCLQAEKLEPFILKNRHGVEAHILPYGAIVQKLTVPDRSGRPTDVVLGFDSLTPYQVNQSVLHLTQCFCTMQADCTYVLT